MSIATPRRPAPPLPVPVVLRSPQRGTTAPFLLAVFTVLAVGSSVHAQAGEDLAQGQALYEGKCGGCHSLDENRVGPRHRGVVGRPIASIPDFDYSPAIRKLGGIWMPARIDQWLQGPQAMAPGAKMFFQVPDPDQRHAIIAYLASQSPK
jgi:cytochrome c